MADHNHRNAHFERDACRFSSRNGNALTRFDALAQQIACELDVDDAILDGEVIAPDETGRPRFYDLLRHTRKPAYVAFDLLWLCGTDLRSWPLRHRLGALEGILPDRSMVILPALSVQGRGIQLFQLMLEHDLEGIVAKRLSDPYLPTTAWFKIKNPAYSQQEGRADLFNARRLSQTFKLPRGQSSSPAR
jgi:bifunctional non-homologous end joining protein LigD